MISLRPSNKITAKLHKSKSLDDKPKTSKTMILLTNYSCRAEIYGATLTLQKYNLFSNTYDKYSLLNTS